MAKRRVRKTKENVKCKSCSIFVKILLLILAILIVIALLYSSGLMGNSVYSTSACVDSDKTFLIGGKLSLTDSSLLKKGSVTSGGTTVTDVCEGTTLAEVICDNGHRDTKKIVCPKGCVDGACKP